MEKITRAVMLKWGVGGCAMSVSRFVSFFAAVAVVVATCEGAARAEDVLSPYDDPAVAAPAPAPGPMIAPAPVPAPPSYVPPPPPLVVPPPPAYTLGCTTALDPCAPRMQYRQTERPRYGLMIAGLIVFTASYMPNAITAAGIGEWRLAVPVAGPFFEAHHVNTGDDMSNRALVAFLVWDGLVQTAGFVMAVAGAATRHKVRAHDRVAVSFVPTGGAQGAGLAAIGRF
jgi:hypothetical protein